MSRGTLYPRKVTTFGAEDKVSALLIKSKLATCGVFVFGYEGGPNGPTVNPPHEVYMYLNGTSPITPMVGGVNEIMNAPASGQPLGPAVIPTLWEFDNLRGITVLGSDRVSSSVKFAAALPNVAKPVPPPAVGIMCHAAADIVYVYVGYPVDANHFILCYGDETHWLAGDTTNQIAVTPPATAIVGTGGLGNYRDGRTVFGNDRIFGQATAQPDALVIASHGASGALILASGDHTASVAMYIDATGKPVFDTGANWLAFAGS